MNDPSILSIVIKSLPSSGTLINSNDNINLTVESTYSRNAIKYSPGLSTPNTFNYVSKDDKNKNSKLCTVTLTICYLSCNTCSQVGDSNNHFCTSCLSSYYPLPDNNSLCYNSNEVVDGYYFSNNIFLKCSSNCKTCSNNTLCLECFSNYFLHTNYCLSICPVTFYNDVPTKKCLPCLQNCRICQNGNECNECNSNLYLHYLQDKKCYTTCPDEYFNNNQVTPYKCDSCPGNCKKCSNSTECTLCNINYFLHLIDKKCYSVCPKKYYGNSMSKNCEGCSSNCYECTNNNICNVCDNNYFLYNNYCLSNCPVGYFNNVASKQCTPCSTNCKNCISENECYVCNTNYYLHLVDKKCYDVCPTRYYGNSTTQNCDNCTSNCLQCANNRDCSKCDTGYFLNYKLDKQCYSTCPPGYYPDNISFNCEQCPLFYIDGTNTCVDICPIQYYPENSTGKCFPCQTNCDGCENATECIYCSEEYFNHNLEECSQTVPSTFYGETSTRKWTPCTPNCDLCSDPDECMNCLPEFYFLPTDFKKCGKCPLKYFPDSVTNKCLQCSDNCLICNNSAECITCDTNFYIFDKRCVSDCPDKFYKNPDLPVCSKCNNRCAKCKNNTDYCIECSKDSFLFPSTNEVDGISIQCLKQCPEDYYPDENKQCKLCNEMGKWIMEKNCVEKCEKGYYKDTTSYQCVKCNKDDEFILDHKCVKKCPDGYTVDNNRVCNFLICKDQCKNDGECYIEDKQIKCRCKQFFEGDFCEIDIPVDPEKIDPNEPISTKAVEFLVNLKESALKDVSKVTPEITNMVSNLAIKQVEITNSGKAKPNEMVLDIFSTAFTLNTIVPNSENTKPTNAIDDLKSNMSNFVDALMTAPEIIDIQGRVLKKSGGPTSPKEIKRDEFSVQYASTSPDNMAELHKSAVKNKISVIDSTECERALKREYKIDDNISLIVKKIDFNSTLNLTGINDTARDNSDSIVYEYFEPSTNLKLNTSICNNIPVRVKAANSKVVSKLSLNSYHTLASSNLDMLNTDSPGYHSRCITIRDPNTGKDATVSFRRNNYYQNKSAECAPNCDYGGLDENGYVICDCKGMMESGKQANSMVAKNFTIALPKFNLDIVFCFKEVLHYSNLFRNAGFYICGSLYIISVIFFILRPNRGSNFIENNLNDIVDNDCVFFNSENMPVEEYFQHHRLKIKKDINLFEKLEANIEYLDNKKMEIPKKTKIKRKMNFKRKKSKIILPKSVKNYKVNNFESRIMIDQTKNNLKDNSNSNEVSFNRNQPSPNIKKVLEWRMQIDNKNNRNSQISLNRRLGPEDDIKIYRNRPYKIGVYFKFPDHVPTKKDFECLNPYKAFFCDDRKFKTILYNMLVEEEHLVFSLIYQKSLMFPFWLDVITSCFTLSILFGLNALLFTDKYIDKRAVENAPDGFFASFTAELPKTITSLIIAIIIVAFAYQFVAIPEKVENEFNRALMTKNKDAIKAGYRIFLEKMESRYRAYFIVTTILNIILWYYVIAFCGIYMTSVSGWIDGSISGLCIDWFAVSLVSPVLRSSIRVLARNYKIFRFLVGLEFLIWTVKSLCF